MGTKVTIMTDVIKKLMGRGGVTERAGGVDKGRREEGRSLRPIKNNPRENE